jgi:hypothetical protein
MPFSAKAVPLFLAFSLSMLFGCAKTVPQPSQPARIQSESVTNIPQAPPAAEIPQPSVAPQAKTEPKPESAEEPPCLECETASPDQDRADCFKLQPGKTTKNSKGKTVTGRCQPQCVPYARCRSGIMTCRLGDTGPVEWFECARKNKATTAIPKAGSIMVIGVNARRKMPTGHLGYVEEACPNADGTWTLRFSHTNFDRKCHLDLDAKVLFNPKTMTASFLSGPWKTWAKDLKISGFILR